MSRIRSCVGWAEPSLEPPKASRTHFRQHPALVRSNCPKLGTAPRVNVAPTSAGGLTSPAPTVQSLLGRAKARSSPILCFSPGSDPPGDTGIRVSAEIAQRPRRRATPLRALSADGAAWAASDGEAGTPYPPRSFTSYTAATPESVTPRAADRRSSCDGSWE